MIWKVRVQPLPSAPFLHPDHPLKYPSMPDESHFLEALQARPDDDAVRLEYAEWLDDQGYPVDADFVRAVVEMRQGYPNGRRSVTRRLVAGKKSWRTTGTRGGFWVNLVSGRQPD